MKKDKVISVFLKDLIMAPEGDLARDLYNKGRFGEIRDKNFHYSSVEALYLLEEDKMEIVDGKNKKLDFNQILNKTKKSDPRLWTRYMVYKDMRKRGYIVKTALRFGADFRVYDRGIKPGEDHAKWVLYCVNENEVSTWHEFSAKNRVAHSTKKKLLIGVVDDEGAVTFYEVKWVRP